MFSQWPREGLSVYRCASMARSAATSLSLFLFCVFATPPAARSQLNFNFTYAADTDPRAVAGFQQAANNWSARINDPITVNLNIGFRDLGSGILGQARTSLYTTSYSLFRSVLNADMTSAADITAVSSLSLSSSVPLYLNRTLENLNSALPYIDNDGDSNNASINLSGANAKALGFAIPDSQDGLIEFNSTFAFDFSRGDGITSGAYDFVGIAAHEIGHTLGFLSTADDIDYAPGETDSAYTPTTLDMFRFSSASRDLTVAGYGTGVPDISADARGKYLSLDRGKTAIANFSTGVEFGDGQQSSHWKDGQGIGIMDPTAGTGELLLITDLDLLAFDVIGYDLAPVEIPEPSALGLMSVASVAFGSVRVLQRRKRLS